MRYLLVLFLLFPILCFGQLLTSNSVNLLSGKVYERVNIDSDKELTKKEIEAVKKALVDKTFGFISNNLQPVKNDYINKYDRGTVKYNPETRNYSFYTVIIPDGTVIESSNFTQFYPYTKSITGRNLVFINCTLVNVDIDASWVLEGSNNSQVKNVAVGNADIGEGKHQIDISKRVKEDKIGGKFVEINKDKIYVDSDTLNNHLLYFHK